MVQDVADRTQSQREVRGGDGALGQVGAELATGVDTAGAADGVDLAEEEGDEPQTGHPPAALGDQERGVGEDGGGQVARGQVRPEDKLRVAGDPPLEPGVSVVVGGGDLVEDPAARIENGAIAGPAEPEAQIDVLVIRAQKRVESTDLPDRFRPVKGA